MTHTPAASFYFGKASLDAIRTLLSERNWQDSGKDAWIERAAVLALVIDWAQGRTNVPAKVAEVMSDLHIGSGASGYSAPQRVNLILAYLRDNGEDRPHSPATPAEKLYAEVTAEGLVNLSAWLETLPVREVPLPVGEADETLDMHPNVRKALKHAGVTSREDISAVLAHSRFRSNVSGGRSSDWISAAADALKRAGSPEALMAQDQADNERLMRLDRVR